MCDIQCKWISKKILPEFALNENYPYREQVAHYEKKGRQRKKERNQLVTKIEELTLENEKLGLNVRKLKKLLFAKKSEKIKTSTMSLIHHLELVLIHQQNPKGQEENKEAPRCNGREKEDNSLALLRR